MTSRDKLGMNGHDPKGKGENWPKFLKEMETLGPIIHQRLGETSLPGNRAEARGQGMKNLDAFLAKETARLAEQQRFRDYKVNQWFDENMRAEAPFLFRLIEKLGGGRWAVLFKLTGYRLKAMEGVESGVPYTLCAITWMGFFKAGLRMFWEDPKGKGIPHERRRD